MKKLIARYGDENFIRQTKRNYTHAAIHQFTFHTDLKGFDGKIDHKIGETFHEATFHASKQNAERSVSQHPWANGHIVAVVECHEFFPTNRNSKIDNVSENVPGLRTAG